MLIFFLFLEIMVYKKILLELYCFFLYDSCGLEMGKCNLHLVFFYSLYQLTQCFTFHSPVVSVRASCCWSDLVHAGEDHREFATSNHDGDLKRQRPSCHARGGPSRASSIRFEEFKRACESILGRNLCKHLNNVGRHWHVFVRSPIQQMDPSFHL